MTEPDPQFHFVLVRDRFSKVVPESDPAGLFQLVDEGWEIVWDSARNEFEGHARAACVRRTVPETWGEETFHSEPIREPLTLYRSVSPGELESIATTEQVMGRGNRFNAFDPRRLVFFGRTLGPGLIWHGEDLERQAMGIVAEVEGTGRWFDGLADRHRKLVDRFEAEYRGAVDRWNAGAKANGKVMVSYREEEAAAVRFHGARVSKHRLGLYGPQPRLVAVGADLDELREEMESVRASYRKQVSERIREMREEAIDAPFTSAVLEFAPMDHGLRYHGPNASSGDGDGEEFGFFPGSVTLDDVVGVTWVARREIVATTGPDAIGEWLEALREHREGQGNVRRFG